MGLDGTLNFPTPRSRLHCSAVQYYRRSMPIVNLSSTQPIASHHSQCVTGRWRSIHHQLSNDGSAQVSKQFRSRKSSSSTSNPMGCGHSAPLHFSRSTTLVLVRKGLGTTTLSLLSCTPSLSTVVMKVSSCVLFYSLLSSLFHSSHPRVPYALSHTHTHAFFRAPPILFLSSFHSLNSSHETKSSTFTVMMTSGFLSMVSARSTWAVFTPPSAVKLTCLFSSEVLRIRAWELRRPHS